MEQICLLFGNFMLLFKFTLTLHVKTDRCSCQKHLHRDTLAVPTLNKTSFLNILTSMKEAIGTTNVTNAIPFNQQLKEIKACYIQEN